MDEKEEGEISLDDISDISSEDERSYRHPSSWDSSRRSRSHTKRDSAHGKENRRHARDAAAAAAAAVQPVKYTMPTLHEKNEDLLLISSDEDLEIVCVPGSSRQVVVQSFKKKRKKKKKKKAGNGGGGDFNFSINDFVSVNEDENERIVDHTIAQKILSRRRRTPSPVHKRKRSPPISRINDYHKSSSYHRSSTRYSRSPSPKRKSPRRNKSPKRTSPPAPVPPPQQPLIQPPVSSTITTGTLDNINYHKKKDITSNHTPKEDNYDEHYASTLLKKVKHLDAVGSTSPKKTNKQKEVPSLKDKLNNMMKVHTESFEIPENKLNDVIIIKEEPKIKQEISESVGSELQNINDTDKTTTATTTTTTNVTTIENNQKDNNQQENNNNNIDDNDEEDLELRMIALRSAVMNKHQNRVKKGAAAKKSKSQKREGSPFSDSFFDHDNIIDSENEVFDSMSVGHTQTTNNQQAEDMDIDSDVEREKIDIYSPSYSPTYSPSYSPPYSPTDDVIPLVSIDTNIDQYNTSLLTPKSPINNSSQYNTPFDKTIKKKLSFTEELIKNSCDDNTDVPYSPTDSAIPYDEMITPPKKLITPIQPPPPIPAALNFSNISNYHSYHQNNRISIPLEQDPVELIPPEILREISSSPNDFPVIIDEIINNHSEQKNTLIKSNIDKQSINSCDSFLTNNIQNNNCVDEPLYLQSIPDITKDINKIPTSINKSLIPMSILKTNKNLQQPLPIKKLEQIPEPTFKSAEMQVVNVVSEQKNSQTNAIFKPIKLQPVVKKTTFNPTPARAFDDISIDDFPIDDLTTQNYNDKDVIITNECTIVDDNFRVTENNYNSTKNNNKSIVNTFDNDNNIDAIVVKNKQKNLLINNKNIVDKNNQENFENSEEKLREKLELKKRKRLSKSELQADDDLNYKKDSVPVEVIDNDDKLNKDKRRRLSIEDDEEELRALLLASLSKRPKVTENIVPIKLPEVPQIIDDENAKNSLKNTTINTKIVSPSGEIVLPPANLTTVSNSAVKIVDKSVVPPVVAEIKKSINPTVNLVKTNVKKVILPTVPIKTINNNIKKITTTTTATTTTTTIQNTVNSTISTMRNKTINNVRLNENIRSTSPKLLSSSKNCRLVINLGEDTDSDTDSECSNNSKNTDKTVVNLPKDDLTIPTTDFEKSVEAFLRDQRKKIESSIPSEQRDAFKKLSTSKVSTGKNLTGLASTPLAVRHLSASRQEEYRRLKQQILDRETKKLQRSLKNLGDKISNNIGAATITSPLSPASPGRQMNKLSPAKPVNNNQIGEIKIAINSDEKSSQINLINNTEKLPINEVSNVDKDNAQVTDKTGEDNALCSFDKAPLELTPSSMELSVEIIDDNLSSTSQMSMEINKPVVPKLSFLKILTTEQLNKKFDDKVRLEKINQVQVDDKSNENQQNKLTIDQAVNLEVNTCDVNTNSIIETSSKIIKPQLILNEPEKISPIVEIPKKITPVVETTKKVDPIVETTKKITPTVETTNKITPVVEPPKKITPIVETPTEIPPVILPSVESNQEKNNTNVNLTITLDDTLDENIPMTNKITEPVIQQEEVIKLPAKKLLNKQRKNKSPAKELSDKIKSDVKIELENLKDLSKDLKKEKLSLIEKDLINNRNLVLNDLTELSENLKQWDIERELQTELTVEVRNLRMQLKLAEERLQEQRTKITKMGPKVAKAHKTIINGRTKCLKLTKLCQGIGSSVIGPRYKVPTTGAQRMVDGLKEVVFHTRQLSKKTTPTNISNKDDEDNEDDKNDNDENHDKIIDKNNKCTEDVCDDDDDQLTDDVIEAVEIIKNNSTIIEDNCRPTCSSTPRNVEFKKTQSTVDKKISETEQVKSKSTISSTQGNFDPNGVLCPYELMGTCNDDGCSYNHLDKNRGQ